MIKILDFSKYNSWSSLDELRGLFKLSPAYKENKVEGSPMFSVMGPMETELEFCEVLYALVRATKPNLILESGCGYGIATTFMGTAVVENGFGSVIAYEGSADFCEMAKKNVAWLPVEVRLGSSLDYTGFAPDFIFLDSASDTRTQEIQRWDGNDGVLAIHDAKRYPGAISGGVFLDSYRTMWFRSTVRP